MKQALGISGLGHLQRPGDSETTHQFLHRVAKSDDAIARYMVGADLRPVWEREWFPNAALAAGGLVVAYLLFRYR